MGGTLAEVGVLPGASPRPMWKLNPLPFVPTKERFAGGDMFTKCPLVHVTWKSAGPLNGSLTQRPCEVGVSVTAT